jgi:hypothetical protein
MQTFTTIKGVSERRRLPRLGKIRLGVKVLAKNGQTYPAEVDYFVVPPEVQQVYGPKPKTLDVMFPVQDRGVIFPQALKWYGSGRGLKCIGDGERAMRLNEQTGAMEPVECPCPLYEQGQCHRRAHLMVILPKINMGGVYQIDIGSYNSIVDLNSGLDYVEALVGRVAMVPLVLSRAARETFGGGMRSVHYPLTVSLATNDVAWINRLRTETATILERQAALVLPAPLDENPAHDEGAVVVREAELEAAPPAPPSQPVTLAPSVTPPPQPPARAADPAGSPRPSGPSVSAGDAATRPTPAPAATNGRAGTGQPRPQPDRSIGPATPTPATAKQIHLIRKLAEERGCGARYEAQIERGLGKAQASRLIEELLNQPPPAMPVLAEPAEEPMEEPVEESYV